MRANLIGEMAKRRITMGEVATCLGIHRNSVRNKLYGYSQFTLDEAMRVYGKYFADCDFLYLFAASDVYDRSMA